MSLIRSTPLASAVLALAALAFATAAHATTPNGLILDGQSVAENLPVGTVVGTFKTLDTDIGDSFDYLLIDNPLDLFVIVGDQLITTAAFDFEAGAQRTVRVRSTDSTNAYIERSFNIAILDRNDPPLGVNLSASGLPEDTTLFGLVGSVTQRGDQDQGDAFTFTLLDDGDGRFVLEGNQLRTATELDFETDPDALLEIEVVDRAGLSASALIPLAIWDRNESPTGVLLSGAPVAEGAPLGTTVGVLAATGDPDSGDSHTYRIVTADGPFVVDGTSLRVTGALDFETKSVFTPTLRATDRAGRFAEATVTVFIADRNEAPSAVILTGNGLFENAPPGTAVGTVSATDPDAGDSHTFTLVGGSGFALSNRQLTATASFDHETTPSVALTVRATDSGGLSKDLSVTIPILDKNEAPSAISLSTLTVAESAAPNALVAFIDVTDPDAGDDQTLLLLQDGNGAFRLDGNILRVGTAGLDFERAPVVSILVRAKDKAGLIIDKAFDIAVSDVDEPASGLAIDPASVRENQPVGTVVGTFTPVGDPDSAQGYTWSLVQNPGSWFAIQGNRLVTTKVIDFETTRSVQLRVRALPPSGAAVEQLVTIDVSDEPEAPTGINISGTVVQEARNEGSFVATLSVTGDPDTGDLPTFSLVQNPGDAFAIQGATLQVAKVLDYETRALYPIKIRATDRSGLFVESLVEIRVLDVNEAPIGVALSKRDIPENAAANSVVGQLTPLGDPDVVDNYTYTLTTNPDDRFELAGDALIARTPFDFEKAPTSFRVTVRVRDQGGLTAETSFLLTVTDVNEPPSPITLVGSDVVENAPVGTVVGEVMGGADPDAGDTSTLIVAADSLGDAFTIANRKLVTRRALDYEAAPTATVTLRLTDAGGHSVEATYEITIGNVPEGPTAVTIDGLTVPENAAVGTVVGHLAALGDPDLGDSHTFAIADDPSFSFGIDGDTLVVTGALDFEAAATHRVSITATDDTGLSATTSFVISVVDDNDPPTAASLEYAMAAIDEDEKNPTPAEVGTIMERLDVQDPEGDTITLTVTGDAARWQVRHGDDWSAMLTGEALGAADLVRYLPPQDFSGNVELALSPRDATSAGPTLKLVLAVEAVNDAPRHEIPSLEIEGWQHAPLDLTAAMGGPLAVSDVDATELEVSLAATDGTLHLATASVTIVSGRVDSDAIVITGDIAGLDTALASLVFTPDQGYVGRTEIVITSDDAGVSGSGGVRSTTDAIGVNVRAAPELIVTIDDERVSNATVFDLGTLGAGAFHTVELVLENGGNEDLGLTETLLALTPQADLGAWVVVTPAARIAPGASTRAVLMLRPPTVGPVRLGLTIASNDPGAALFAATLTARANAAPDVRITDGERELAAGLPHVVRDLVPDETTRFDLRLDNLGAARLDLGEVAVVNTSNVALDYEEPFPLIDAGDDDVLVVYLTPTFPGPFAAVLELPTNDPDMPIFTVMLAGDAVTSTAPRLVLERVRGVILTPGRDDDVGYARSGEDLPLALRLINLGVRDLKGAAIEVANEVNCAARSAAAEPEVLAAGDSLAFALIVRPEIAGPFSVDLIVGDATWHLMGEAVAGSLPVPADALRLYRWGDGPVTGSDQLGPVTPLVPFVAGWSIVNDGPDRVDLALPIAVSALINIDALPLLQPETALPPQRAQLVPFAVTALDEGAVAFDISGAGLTKLRVASAGQVGRLQLTSSAGDSIAPDATVALPLQKLGKNVTLTLFADNIGTGPLTLGAITFNGGPACIAANALTTTYLGTGERATFDLVFAPVVGPFECTLTVNSSDAGRAAYVVSFSARGVRAGKDGCEGGDHSLPGALAGLTLLVSLFVLRTRSVRLRF